MTDMVIPSDRSTDEWTVGMHACATVPMSWDRDRLIRWVNQAAVLRVSNGALRPGRLIFAWDSATVGVGSCSR
ncbi:hypothetical protein BKN51_07060 [Amycolatopsis sp. BJA-103]|nr:hypothetical protein BKN51_07060 [Amycolatopsis sp. BJA-103]